MRNALILTVLLALLVSLFGCSAIQRKLLYFPSHRPIANELSVWMINGTRIGYAREVPSPTNVWLMLHGNGGQAAHRTYALPCFSDKDSVYILEYPGYGLRLGEPSKASINQAAEEAYVELRRRFPEIPICVASESLGSGPACHLASLPKPPAKLVMIVPFDLMDKVAAAHFPKWLVSMLLSDKWDNIQSLTAYSGPIEIFGATHDTVIPISHAKNLAASKAQSIFHEIAGGHNDWSDDTKVQIRNP